ncbi:hypothetical protein TcBrA4_0038650 [Trypanosoma cruzi]|nr:hypothetical protein TcBrA4_0038650 [Trypanosoma cruzi]
MTLGRQLACCCGAGEDGGGAEAWEAMTGERGSAMRSCRRRSSLAATSDDLGRQLRAVEQAKTEVEQSLEAVTTERDELREELAATSD